MEHKNICEICLNNNINQAGIVYTEKDIIPFIKSLLKVKYPNHPLPMKYSDSLGGLFAYGQAITHDRIHNLKNRKFFTENKLLLKFKDELNIKFNEIIISDKKEMYKEPIQLVCEFNYEKI